ncbi:MAG: hypothetical protein ACM33B_11070 [Pseudomonadota bacterium]
MRDAALLLLPVAALALVSLAGVGVVALLAPGLPRDAASALAPLAGTALLAAASTLLPLGAPTRPVIVVVLCAGVVLGVPFVRTLRGGGIPLLLALGAIVLAGAPAVARGSWEATSLYGSTDAYHWVSQGRAYLDGPAPPPVESHPDRLTYERSRDQHWAVAVPMGVAAVAWLSGRDPAEAYGALGALLFALLPLATYAAARALVAWEPPAAAAAGAAVALNASLLFASHFSWQQQLAGTALAFGSALTLRLGLEPEAPRRLLLLAALLAAAALATYRLGFAPYLGGLLVAVTAAYAVRDRGAVRRAALFLAAAVVLATPSLAALARGLPEFVDSGGFSTAFKEHFPRGQPGEALGLVPRVWAIEEGWAGALRAAWLLVASALTVVLLVAGARLARRTPRGDFLLAGGVLVLGGWLVLQLPRFAPYLSYKLLAYGAPFLVLLALAPLARRRRVALTTAAGALLVASAASATVLARDARRAPIVDAEGLPADAVVEIGTDDPWAQAWAVYSLRDVRVSVERPTYLLTAQGRERDAAAYRRRPVTHVLRETGVVPAPS